MKVGIYKRFSIALILIAATASLGLPFFSEPAHAASESYLFFFKDGDKSDVQKGLDGKTDLDRNNLTKTTVYIKDGIFGDNKVPLYYDSSGSSVAGKPRYTTTYYCFNNKPVTSLPPNQAIPSYQTIELTATITGSPDVTKSGISSHILPAKLSYDATYIGTGPGSVPRSCLPSAVSPSSSQGSVGLENYNQLTSGGKRAWGSLQTSTEASAASNPSTSAGTGEDDDEPTCQSEGGALAWVFCPMIEIIHDTVGKMMKDFILNQLEYDPLSVVPGDGNTAANNLYNVWGNIRALANILFVLIFLFIVFANTVGMNINAYTVKKMLPRLVAAVVLVQVSFIICSLVIDAGNIAGQGLGSLITTALPGAVTEGAGSGIGVGWSVLSGAILAILAVVIITKIGIAAVLLLALGAFFSVLSVVITLILRDLIISVLVITSPLAFAAWVLPGTEKIFKTWWRLFVRIIVMYPMIVLLFSVSSVLSAASAGTTGTAGFVQSVIAGIFPIIAFFMVPWTFKWAGGAMAMTAGYVDGWTSRAGAATDRGLRNSKPYQANQQRLQARRDLRSSQKLGNQLGSSNAARRAWGTFMATGAPFGGRLNPNGGWGKTSPAVQQKADDALKQARETAQNNLQNTGTQDLKDKFAATDASGKLKNKTMGVAAIGELAKRGQLTSQHLAAIQKTYGAGSREAGIAMKYAQGQMSDKAKDNHPILAYADAGAKIDAAGNFTEISKSTHDRITQNTSPKSLGSLTQQGLADMLNATVKDEKGNDMTYTDSRGNTRKRNGLDAVATHTLNAAVNDPKITRNMHPDVLRDLRAEARNR
ncbi:hypothetical protein EPO04_03245 [Patescibacteria group bacterium]|nr:MAG: hypothetical protein EPO04_03245 [Patescibacteria group bacterium]